MNIQRVDLTGKYAAALSLIEITLGSALHALLVPFAGHFLSLNQGYFLCRASLEARSLGLGRGIGYGISNVTAVLKSLSPAGKKLGPMLSLSVQGILFSLGEGLFGANVVGLSVGMALLSFWALLQPLLLYYLFFGRELLSALAYVAEKILPYRGLSWRTVIEIVAALMLVKVLLAIGLACFACWSGGKSAWQDRLLKLAREKGERPSECPKNSRARNLRLAAKDLTRPFFLCSLAITGFFVYFSERSQGERAWILLRPLALGFLFFYFSRSLTLDRWLEKMQGTRADGFARSCRIALSELRHVGTPKDP